MVIFRQILTCSPGQRHARVRPRRAAAAAEPRVLARPGGPPPPRGEERAALEGPFSAVSIDLVEEARNACETEKTYIYKITSANQCVVLPESFGAV